MTVPRRIETSVRVRFEECLPGGEARASAYLRYAQDAAWVHSNSAGFGRDWYAERGLTWLVRCVELTVLGACLVGDTATVATEVEAIRRVWARRRGEVFGPDGGLAAVVLTDWVMTGPDLTPVRVPAEFSAAFPSVPETFDPTRVPLPPTPAGAHRRHFDVRRSETDPMDHVNNAVYLDYLEESLVAAGAGALLDTRPRRYRLEYQRAAEPGAALTGATWRDGDDDGDGWAYRLSDEAGADLLRARFSAPSPGA
jgi:acyl-ACP thioesterase